MIEYAMENHSNVRELASILVSDMYGVCVSTRHITHAFNSLLLDLEELSLDTPDAPDVLGKFIARAVADDCLAPAFLQNRPDEDSTLAR